MLLRLLRPAESKTMNDLPPLVCFRMIRATRDMPSMFQFFLQYYIEVTDILNTHIIF